MFSHKHYVPVLKGKRAEFPALSALHSQAGITPLMEPVPTSPPIFVPQRMADAWQLDSPYFIDMLFLDEEDADAGQAGAHPLRLCFDQVAALGQHAIPITGTGRSPAYQTALRHIVRQQRRGFGIRLVPEDFEDEEDLAASIAALLKLIGSAPKDVDLLVDGDGVHGMAAATLTQMHLANLAMIPDLTQWRTLTVLAGAFPTSLAPLAKGWSLSARCDWLGWLGLFTRSRKPARLPAYGDYAISHTDLPPTGRATILAQIRYTTPDAFLIWKGHNVFTHAAGYGQFISICRDLVGRPEYRGQGFSAGDAEIHTKATTGGSPGNAETWRKIGVNHHLETVKDGIATHPAL